MLSQKPLLTKPFWNFKKNTPGFTSYKTLAKSFNHPAGILVLDVDETLLAKDDSIIKLETIKELIRKAKANKYLVVIATARSAHSEANKKQSRQVKTVVETVGPDCISRVYFTNHQPKLSVMEYLLLKYFPQDRHGKQKLCLVDNDEVQTEPCNTAGFRTILVDKKRKYLEQVNSFIHESVFSTLTSKDEKERIVSNLVDGSLIPEQLVKANDQKSIDILFNTLQPAQLVYSMVYTAISCESTSAQFLRGILVNSGVYECNPAYNKKSALQLVIENNSSDKTKVIYSLIKDYKLSQTEVELMRASKNHQIVRLYHHYQLAELIRHEEDRLLHDCGVFSFFKTKSRQDKIIQAKNLQKYIFNHDQAENFLRDMPQAGLFLASRKLSAIYTSVAASYKADVIKPPVAVLKVG